MTEPHANLHAAFARQIDIALDALEVAGTLPGGLPRGAVTCEPPRDPSHGDLATNAAMVLAKPAKTNPRALAAALVAELEKAPHVTSAEIAGPGNPGKLARKRVSNSGPQSTWI